MKKALKSIAKRLRQALKADEKDEIDDGRFRDIIVGATDEIAALAVDSPKHREAINHLVCVHNSCIEGYTMEWNSSTDEGREAFLPMASDLVKGLQILGIELHNEAKRFGFTLKNEEDADE
jgi:hypothetical protein